MATRLDLASYRSVPGFLRAGLAIRKQVQASEGALGISLLARPSRKRFLTLTAWTDQDAINRFVAAPPHRDAMKRYRPKMNHPVFVSWTMPAAQMPPSWADALERLENDPSRIVR